MRSRVAEIAGQVRVKWMLAFSHHLCGNQAVAEEHCDSALGLDPTSGELASVVSRPSRGFFSRPHLGTLARTQWLRGHADRALAAARRAFDGVAALKHSFEKSSALILCEGIFVWCGEWGDAARLLDMLSELVERYSLGSQRGGVMALRGELLVKTGRPGEGCDLLRTATAMLMAAGNKALDTTFAAALAEGLAAAGKDNRAHPTAGWDPSAPGGAAPGLGAL